MLLPLLLSIQATNLVVINANIWSDGKLTPATCMAVVGGRIAYVGPFTSRYSTKNSRIIDAKGRMVVPGLIDSHTHLVESGPTLVQLDLREATSQSDFLRRIRDYAARIPVGQWVVGSHWSAESWPERMPPKLADLDAAVGDHPAVFPRMDGHSILVNSRALRLSRIDASGPADPPGGVIDRDPESHEPTGMLRERAQGLVPLPDATPTESYEGLKAAIRMANGFGITSVCDICSIRDVPTWRRYFAENSPTLRTALYFRTSRWEADVRNAKAVNPIAGWMEPRGLKAYMDGSLGSRTAFMHAPFVEQLPGKPADWRGVPMPGAVDGTYKKGFRLAADAGLQVIVHAIGDQANHDVLDLFAGIPNIGARRFRVEHAQHLLPEDIARFGILGVIPSMQPYHKADDGRYCDRVIGPERSQTSYAFHSLLKSGARLAFGSDWDVVTIDPFVGIQTAVTGRIRTGRVWQPQQDITFDQALLGYTKNAAYAMKMEREIGSLKPGKRGDFVILDGWPYGSEAALSKVHAAAVYVEGRKVFP